MNTSPDNDNYQQEATSLNKSRLSLNLQSHLNQLTKRQNLVTYQLDRARFDSRQKERQLQKSMRDYIKHNHEAPKSMIKSHDDYKQDAYMA